MNKSKAYTCAALIILSALLHGCQSTVEEIPTTPVLSLNLSFESQPIPGESEIFTLPEQASEEFLAYYNNPENQETPGHLRLHEFLDKMLSGFDYHHGTFDAATAYQQRSGNCLSLAILTTALAELADVDISYRQVHSSPIYKKHGQIMTLSSHVRTRLYDPDFIGEKDEIVILPPHVVIDYFPRRGNVGASNVSRAQFIAKYYQNLAGDALVKRDYDLAFSYLQRARNIDPNNAETLNTLGVLLRQTGQYEQAEKTYLHIMEHTPGSLNTVANYIVLLESMGRNEEATDYQKRFDLVDDDNPYRWFELAEQHYKKENYRMARRFYKKSIELGPYLNEAHFGLAKAFYMTGSHDKAEQALQDALALTYLPEEKSMYQAKLNSLNEQ